MKTFYLDLSNAMPFSGELFADLCLNGLMVRPKHEEEGAPCPWDAGVEVTRTEIRIEGGVGPSGYGRCSVTVPKKSSMGDYVFFVEVEENSRSQMRRVLEEYNIDYQEENC